MAEIVAQKVAPVLVGIPCLLSQIAMLLSPGKYKYKALGQNSRHLKASVVRSGALMH